VCGLDWPGSERGQVESSCDCSNKPMGSITSWGTMSGYTTGGPSNSVQLRTVG
jgi:hypothetical protein